MNEWQDGYLAGWVAGFIGAIATIYLVRQYFPELVAVKPDLHTRLLVIRKEDTADAPVDASG